MKYIITLFVLCSLVSGAHAATVSGTIYHSSGWYNSNGPAAYGLKIYLVDSSTVTNTVIYRDSTYTNASGFYSFSIPSSITTGNMSIYNPAACYAYTRSGWSSAWYAYSGANLTINDTLHCPVNLIIDTVRNGTTGLPVYGQKVYLLDSNARIVYRDSAYTDKQGTVGFNCPYAIQGDSVRIYTNACGWQSRSVYTNDSLWLCTAPTLNICISSAVVSGTLTAVGSGAALPYSKVNLIDSSGAAVIYADSGYTDVSGRYAFNIPLSVTTGTMIVSKQSCGSRFANRSTFSGSNLTINLAACFAAPTVSGSLRYYNGGPGAPAYNQMVYLIDSTASSYYIDSTLSDYLGQFSFSMPPSILYGSLMLRTTACGTVTQNVTYSGTSISNIYLSACATGYQYSLYGSTKLGGAPNTGPTMLYLIQKKYDAVLGDTTLTALDSFQTIGTTGNFNRTYTTSPYTMTNGGVYSLLLKAALLPAHPSYSSYLPAYASSSLNWNGAARVDSSATNMYACGFYGTTINLTAGVNPGGSGFIGGSVLLGANKSTNVGDPLMGRILLLTDASGQAVAFTYSDASGQFSFSNLDYGTYEIFGDAWGKDNPPLTVTLSAASPSVGNIIFEENSSAFKGHYDAVGIPAQPGLASLRVYPNPASNHVSLQGLAGIEGDKQVLLHDIHGRLLSNTHVKAGLDANIPTSQLPTGMYLLQVQTTKGTEHYKFIRQ